MGLDMRAVPSPNQGMRRDGLSPSLIILHYTAMPDTDQVVKWLCTPEAQVSAHYVISPQGVVTTLVPEDQRAWHAGASCWGALGDVNSASVGIELVNDGASPFAASLMDACEVLVGQIMGRWGIPPARVIGHSDVAPGRKIDPGARFDWARLARQGLALLPKALAPVPFDAQALETALTQIGYTAPVPLETRLAAFRHRMRPWAKGAPDGTDLAQALDIAARAPVDDSLISP